MCIVIVCMRTWLVISCFSMGYRQALKTFLESSNMYRPAVVLGKIKDTDLQLECALVYGKVLIPHVEFVL